MKILLVGNHTCGNRGDGAILRGLIDAIEKTDSSVNLDIISRYPMSSSYLLGRNMSSDILFSYWKNSKKGLRGRIKKLFDKKFSSKIIIGKIEKKGLFRFLPLPEHFKNFVSKLEEYDAVIQVGGSFFVDLYGVQQFEHSLCSLYARKTIFLVGHSVGPFKQAGFNKIANFVFEHVDGLILRENISLKLMDESNISRQRYIAGSDTAWLVENKEIINPSYALKYWSNFISKNKVVAITLRELAPFDKRLNISQKQYEMAFAELIDSMIEKGFEVIAFSTCTGIESYHKDDRMVALSVRDFVRKKSNYHIVTDEFNDHEIGILLSGCYLTVGTRLHSAIISMNFGTPAIAINYEHKSLGVMNQLSMPELAVNVNDLFNGVVLERIEYIVENYEAINERMNEAVEKERALGIKTVEDILNKLQGKK